MILDKDFKMAIKSPEGEHLADLAVRKWYTIWDVKTMIRSRTGAPQQRRKLEFWGRQFDDFATLAECDMGDKPSFTMVYSGEVLRELKILVKSMDSRSKCFSVYSIDNAINLKKMIEVEYGIASRRQILVFAGEHLEDYRTFDDYEVEDGSTIVCPVRRVG